MGPLLSPEEREVPELDRAMDDLLVCLAGGLYHREVSQGARPD